MTRAATVPNVRKMVKLVQEMGLTVAGVDVFPDGGFRVLTAQEKQDAADAALDGWLRSRNG
ncbi:hypothetical protein [Paracoccus chinensis]|uniref:Uncharacterized protein n=1 Tax=Paracoccus chinensis TaxID=525640 RepID=A0A1G9DF60_9RHOB|nr:hypothetical protein [Paracoccus chinensis]SDK62518.1 hypothetical protein SAMN04487971_10237 [Paracoccus chinensis]